MQNKEKGLISIVIPTYQHAKSLPDCLNSLKAQTYKKIEIIIVNDGSTDGTEKVLEGFKDDAKIIHQTNQGSNFARQRGFLEVKGEYVIFFDADIVAEPNMLEKMVQVMIANKEISFVYSGFYFGWKQFKSFDFDIQRLKEMNYIHTTSLIRMKDFPGFDKNIKRFQDWDLWLTMAIAGKKGYRIPEILFHIGIDGNSRIGSSWLPSFFYRIPWPIFGYMPQNIKKYREAKSILLKKHQI